MTLGGIFLLKPDPRLWYEGMRYVLDRLTLEDGKDNPDGQRRHHDRIAAGMSCEVDTNGFAKYIPVKKATEEQVLQEAGLELIVDQSDEGKVVVTVKSGAFDYAGVEPNSSPIVSRVLPSSGYRDNLALYDELNSGTLLNLFSGLRHFNIGAYLKRFVTPRKSAETATRGKMELTAHVGQRIVIEPQGYQGKVLIYPSSQGKVLIYPSSPHTQPQNV